MPDSPVRVALLARAGDARDQLRRALIDLGAEVVADGDPSELDPGTLAGCQPAVVVVSLEPAIEDALAEFEDLLAMPGVQVIYDDAEVTGRLDGWDLARWARHLAAKLAGTEAVLPPAPEHADQVPEAEMSLEPGAPRTPAEEMDHARLEDYAAESIDLSQWVPSTPSLTDVQIDPAPEPSGIAGPPETDTDLDLDLDLDMAGLEEALAPRQEGASAAAAGPSSDTETADSLDFDPGAPGTGDDADLGDFIDFAAAEVIDTTGTDAGEVRGDDSVEALLVDFEVSDEPIRFSSFSDEEDLSHGTVDDDVAALAAHLDAFEANDSREGPREPDFALVEEASADLDGEPEAAPAAPAIAEASAPSAFSGNFGTLELAPMDAEPPVPLPSATAPARSGREAPRVAPSRGLSLADAGASLSETAPTVRGALLVLAGLGGPDGVRQLLSALPSSLPVPVLLYQHLDTGKHERLVGQLAKASKPAVDLAVEGAIAGVGRVAVLPPGLGVEPRGGDFAFAPTGSLAALVEALPAGDSVVLVLSGCDTAVVASVLTLKRAGGLVLAQDPASCFDPGAPQALVSAGATTGTLPELADLIFNRWS